MNRIIQYLCVLLSVFVLSRSFDGEVEYPKGSKKSLMEFINGGRGNETIKIEKNAIMVLGLSGTGKTTLVNYLNGIEMICLKKDKKWIVDLKNENNTLPGGFRIGHGSQSKTLYPAIYTPIGENYSYVDNPGFSDTRGVGIEISNSSFREEVTKHVENL